MKSGTATLIQLPKVHRHVLLHPAFLFISVWVLAGVLYAARLSHLLKFGVDAVLEVLCAIVLPFAFVSLLSWILSLSHTSASRTQESVRFLNSSVCRRRIHRLFLVWAFLSLVEIVHAKGTPFIWLILNIPRDYFSFGIPSLHGMLNAMILGISAASFFMYKVEKRQRHLVIPIICLAWSIIIISRQILVTALVEFAVIMIATQRFSLGKKVSLSFAALGAVVFFGLIGNFRTGLESFTALAQPRNFPDWIPSGFLWGYMYLTTPLNNLLNTIALVTPAGDPIFKETVAQLFPTVIRNIVYGDIALVGPKLVEPAFNTSTAFCQPFIDMGFFGIILFSTSISVVVNCLWYRRKITSLPTYAVLAQCLLISTFVNPFFYLPIITQVVWTFLIFRGTERSFPVSQLKSCPVQPGGNSNLQACG